MADPAPAQTMIRMIETIEYVPHRQQIAAAGNGPS
jgi:hypothetical protein